MGNFIAAFTPMSKPVQRQRWGDHQQHPVVNWGDLFFDLFYVAAAYNLASIILESPSAKGLLYFVSCFWAVFHLWCDRTFYDARYYTGDDIWHRCIEIGSLFVLATAVANIRPAAILSTPSENIEMFAFALAMSIGKFLSMVRCAEIMVWVDGQPVAKIASRRDLLMMTPSLLFFVAATIHAGLEYFGSNNGDHRYLAGDTATSDTYDATKQNTTPYPESTNIPIILLLSASLTYWLQTIFLLLTLPGGGRHKEITVPINVDFVIHRYGEWVMLLLGESILSLLIVEVTEGSDYYVTFYAGILSVILLQLMHFRSQPAHADDHAMRRSKEAGFAFAFFMQVYSAGLVLLGVSYKMLLYEFFYESDLDGGGRFLFDVPRWLAGGRGALLYETEDRRQRIANFFCGSLATVWFCSDVMIVVHRGLKDNLGRFICCETKKTKVKGALLVLVRFAMIAFIATFSQHETNPKMLSLIGLSGIFVQLLLRIFLSMIFHSDRVHDAMTECAKEAEIEREQIAKKAVLEEVTKTSTAFEDTKMDST